MWWGHSLTCENNPPLSNRVCFARTRFSVGSRSRFSAPQSSAVCGSSSGESTYVSTISGTAARSLLGLCTPGDSSHSGYWSARWRGKWPPSREGGLWCEVGKSSVLLGHLSRLGSTERVWCPPGPGRARRNERWDQARQSIRLFLGTAQIDHACVAVYGTKVASKAAAAVGLAAASTK